jgi:hypothetical protein
MCRENYKTKQKKYRVNNKDNISLARKKCYEKKKDYYLQKSKEYQNKNKEQHKQANKKYYEKHKQKIQKYRDENKDKMKIYNKHYRQDKRHHCNHDISKKICRICNPNGYLKSLVGGRLAKSLYRNKTKTTIEYLGCDIETFRTHLEKSFKEGMTWENQGEWHIDHIIPVLYKHDSIEPSIEEVGKRLHYTNCQAMWGGENISKGNRYIG